MSVAAVVLLDDNLSCTRGGGTFAADRDRLELRFTTDSAEIEAVIRDPAVFPMVIDDHSPSPESVDVRAALGHGGMGFLGVYLSDVCVGVTLFVRHSMTVTEMHVAMTPRCRGRIREAALAGTVDALLAMPGCDKLMTMVPRPHRAGALAAIRAGFVEEGVLTKSFLAGGVLHDQRIFGLTRGAHELRCASAAGGRR